MNILLVTSAAPKLSPFSTEEKRPPLGIGFLISVLRNAGHKVFFIDNYLKPSDFLENGYLILNNIDYIGTYANTICYSETLQMLFKIQELRKNKKWAGKIIIGGPHTTVALETIPDFVDYIVQGEGEKAILEILEGKVGRVVRPERIKELDILPIPAWDYFVSLPYDDSVQWFNDRPVFSMNASRGCPFSCAFCSVCSVWGKQYTYFSAERIVSDIKYLSKKYGAKAIYFREDNFTLNRKRVVDFCETLLSKGIKIKWICETRVDTIDYDLIKLMYRAGCKAYYLGIESANQRLLDFIKKGITVEQVEKVFKWCRQIGMSTAASFVVGIPTETEEERVQTVYFAKKIRPTNVWFNVFVGVPRSELYDYVLKNELYEYIDNRGLVYLKGHDSLVDQFYGGDKFKKVPRENIEKAKKFFSLGGEPQKDKAPKISVIMSTYNKERFIREAIDSILNQTLSGFEFIIVNDGSVDKTAEILQGYTDPRIKVVNNEKNLGLTKSLNIGLKLAKGGYIARMDVDDISLPQRFQIQADFLDKNLNVGLLGTSVIQIDEEGKVITEISMITESVKLKEELYLRNLFCHGSIMMRRECIEKVRGYREEFRYAQDYDLYLRIIEYTEVANLGDFLYKWRITTDCVSIANKPEQDKYVALARQSVKNRRNGKKEILLEIGQEKGTGSRQSQRALAWYYYNWARALCGQNRMQESRGMLIKALRIYPLYLGTWFFYFVTFLPFSWLKRIRLIVYNMQKLYF